MKRKNKLDTGDPTSQLKHRNAQGPGGFNRQISKYFGDKAGTLATERKTFAMAKTYRELITLNAWDSCKFRKRQKPQ